MIFRQMITLTLLAVALTGRAWAQAELDLTREADPSKLIPISMTGFSGEVAAVLKFDLEISGFQFVGAEATQYQLSGSNDGAVEGILSDRITKARILANRYSGGSLRVQAHSLADDIVQKLTGRPGIGKTRVAFVGRSSGGVSEIYVADFDGANAAPITPDKSIVASPSWRKGQGMILYTSYKSGYPDIWSHDLASGRRLAVAKYPGLNTSGAISPDGRRVAMILSKGGKSTDLYVCDVDGGNLRQLTRGLEDESSPCWSPDGRTLCYVASRPTPQLFLIGADGSNPRRLPTAGVGKPTEPDWSPDGKTIAFTSMMGRFQICTVPAQGGAATPLIEGEDPSWSPNSRTLMFTRKVGGRTILSLLDVPTKRVKDVALNLGSCSQPSWAK